uniref:Ribosomal protein S2 n=1 Tax=Ulva rigida TaxID=75689 RepID=A0A7L9R4U6_9CHLO|nr:ribosomal protein S2 [Ulva rigida]QOL10413.1 ribosomal protein S2 [Ulva rigida]
MIFIINNNTTHNYSRYSTGPSRIYNAENVKCPIQAMINHSPAFDNNQNNKPHLFQTKQLLCWGPDIAFFNLTNTFLNIFKALQLCWSAARNNKKILFINGKQSISADSTLVNAWLMRQYKRHSMPRKLNNISNYFTKYTSNLLASSEYSINTGYTQQNKVLFNHLSSFLNSCCIKMPHISNTKGQSFIKNSNSLFYCLTTFARSPNLCPSRGPLVGKGAPCRESNDFDVRNCSQLRHTQTNNSIHRGKTKPNESKKRKLKTQKAGKTSKHSELPLPLNEHKLAVAPCPRGYMPLPPLPKGIYALAPLAPLAQGELRAKERKGTSSYDQLKVTTNNSIRLQVKEAQILTQQITSEITIPLNGFLTNTKTGFTTLQQLNNQSFTQFKSVYLNNSLLTLVKNTIHIPTIRQFPLHNGISNQSYENINKLQSSYSTSIYRQHYLPFSFYVRPVNNGVAINDKLKQKQCIVRQNIFGKILAWRLKGQYPSSMFYSKFKIFDQRFERRYQSKQLTVANNKTVDAGVLQLKLMPAKPQVLFKNNNDFITLNKSVRLVRKRYKTSLQFYSKFKLYRENQLPAIPADTVTRGNIHNPKVLLKSLKPLGFYNSVKNFYISRFYQSINNSSMYKKKCINTVNSTKPSELFRTNFVLKAYKESPISTPKHDEKKKNEKKFCNYYDKLINSNQLNQYEMFAKSPYANNKLADIIFFINPEKNQNLVNQANCLKIPTIGVVSGIAYSDGLGRRSCNHYNLNNLVNYPILGNPSSQFFVYTLVGVFVKALSSS